MFALFGILYILGALGVILCVLLGHFGIWYVITALTVVASVVIDSIGLEKRLRNLESKVDK